MADELMSLKEINRHEEMLFGAGALVSSYSKGLFETARAAHEWKAKYDARKVEVATIVEENEKLREQLRVARVGGGRERSKPNE